MEVVQLRFHSLLHNEYEEPDICINVCPSLLPQKKSAAFAVLIAIFEREGSFKNNYCVFKMSEDEDEMPQTASYAIHTFDPSDYLEYAPPADVPITVARCYVLPGLFAKLATDSNTLSNNIWA